MPKVEWDGWKINLGHVLTILTMLVTCASILTVVSGAYSAMRTEVSELARWRAEASARLERLAANDDALRSRMTDGERDMVRAITRLETRMDSVIAEMARIARIADRGPP